MNAPYPSEKHPTASTEDSAALVPVGGVPAQGHEESTQGAGESYNPLWLMVAGMVIFFGLIAALASID